MRLPYMPSTPSPSSTPAVRSAYSVLSARRSPAPLLDLDLALLHSPAVAVGWSSFLGAIRSSTSLSGTVRELIICRIAVLNDAPYEWEQHIGLLRAEGQIGGRAVRILKGRKAYMGWGMRKAWKEWEMRQGMEGGEGEEEVFGGLTEEYRAVLAYTDAMTEGIKVSDELFGNVRRFFDEQAVVEITATAAAYNCVSRFLVALDVGEMSERGQTEKWA